MSAIGSVGRLLKLGMVGVLGVSGVADCRFDVKRGRCALISNSILGVKYQVYREGTHFKLPWVDQPIHYDVGVHPHFAHTIFRCSDRRMVEVSVCVDAHALPDEILTISSNYGHNHTYMVMPLITEDALKDVGTKFSSKDLTAQKEVNVWSVELIAECLKQGGLYSYELFVDGLKRSMTKVDAGKCFKILLSF